MGDHSRQKIKGSSSSRKRRRKGEEQQYDDDSSPSSSSYSISLSGDDDYDGRGSNKRRRRSSEDRRQKKSSTGKKDKKSASRRKRGEKERSRSKHKSKLERRKKEKYCSNSDESDESESSRLEGDDDNSGRENPEEVVKCILKEFPAVSGDLEQLLQMIDGGQAVDISGLSERTLVKELKRLFLSLNLKETGDHVFLLKSGGSPTLDVLGPIIRGHGQPQEQKLDQFTSEKGMQLGSPDERNGQLTYDANLSCPPEDAFGPRRRCPDVPIFLSIIETLK